MWSSVSMQPCSWTSPTLVTFLTLLGSLIWIEPHHSSVLKPAFSHINKVSVWILQCFCSLFGCGDVLHPQLLCLKVEITESQLSQVVVHDLLEGLGALFNGIPPSGARKPNSISHRAWHGLHTRHRKVTKCSQECQWHHCHDHSFQLLSRLKAWLAPHHEWG